MLIQPELPHEWIRADMVKIISTGDRTILHQVEDPNHPTKRRPVLPRGGRRRSYLLTAFLALPILFTLLLFAYPMLEMLRLSFTENQNLSESWGDNYKWFFTNPTQMTILRRTFLVSVFVTIICVLLGFPYAYAMTVVGPRTRLLMMGAVLLPFWSNLVVRTYAWVVLLQDTGPIRAGLKALDIDSPSLIGNMTGITIGATQVLLPFFVLPLYATTSKIDRQLLTAAESLGAPPRIAFIRVYIPLTIPGVRAGALIVFVLMLGFYFTPALLGSTSNSLISQQIVAQVSQLLAFGRGSAMAVILLFTTFAALGLISLVARRYSKNPVEGGQR